MRFPFFRKKLSAPEPSRSVRHARFSGYDAAINRPLFGDMSKSRGSADYEIVTSLDDLRGKTRGLLRNSGMYRRYVWLLRINVVGENGFRFQSRVKRQDGKLDVTLNDRVENAWADFCTAPTVDGEMDMVDLTHLAISTWAQDGEVIWELVFDQRYPFGFAIDPIESDLLDHTLNITHSNGNQIRMGVEFDTRKRPVAYHFLTSHPGDLTWFDNGSSKRYRRVPADRVIRMYDRDRVGQTRGVPPAVSTIGSVHMLDSYREAETVFRRLMAAMGGFFKKAAPESVPSKISEMADGKGTDFDGGEVFEMNMEPGVFRQIPDGLEPVTVSLGGTSGDYSDFERQQKMDIANGMNLSTFTVGQETAGVSYSTGRSVLIEDRNFYKVLQSTFVRGLFTKLFRVWVRQVIIHPDHDIPATRIAAIIAAATFRPRGWDWVDPAKDVSANTEALATGQTSLARVAAQRGIDRDELLDEIAEDKQAAEQRGLTLDYGGGKNTTTDAQTSQKQDDADE
jgi:lambda family phage portal protein